MMRDTLPEIKLTIVVTRLYSLAPGRFGCDFKNSIFNLVLLIGILRSSYDNALRWMPQNITDDKAALVQVMAWCCQATSHYLSQCWPRSISPYGVIRPRWIKWSFFPHRTQDKKNIGLCFVYAKLSCLLLLLLQWYREYNGYSNHI